MITKPRHTPKKNLHFYFICTNVFSYSCGYRKAFEEYVTIINERYPQISIDGANYEPSGINFLLSKFILAAKMIFILIIVSQYDIWGQLGQAVPRWFQWCTENKIYACMMVFFVGNMLEAQVIFWFRIIIGFWFQTIRFFFLFWIFPMWTLNCLKQLRMKKQIKNHCLKSSLRICVFVAGVIGCLRN